MSVVTAARRPAIVAYGWVTALSVLASSAVSVAIPALAADLRLGVSAAGWVLAGFSVTFPVGTVLFGRVADAYGQRRAWAAGITLFIAGSTMATTAPWFALIVAGRLIQGLGAGAIPTLAIARLAGRGSRHDRARAVGYLTAVVSSMSGTGPLLGGFLASAIHWRAALALPVLALAAVRRVYLDLLPGDGDGSRVDLVGAVLTTGVIAVPLVALRGISGSLGVAVLSTAAATVLLALLVLHVRRHPHGFLRAELLRDRTLIASSVAAMTLLAVYLGCMLAVPLILADTRGWSALQIGLAVLPAAALGVVTARAVPAMTRKRSPRTTAIWPAAFSLAGVALVASAGNLVLLITGLGLTSVGSMGGQVIHTTAVLRDESDPLAASAVGTFQLFLFAGGALGPVLLGAVADATSLTVGISTLAALAVAAGLSPRFAASS